MIRINRAVLNPAKYLPTPLEVVATPPKKKKGLNHKARRNIPKPYSDSTGGLYLVSCKNFPVLNRPTRRPSELQFPRIKFA